MNLFKGSEPWFDGYPHQRPGLWTFGSRDRLITAGGLVLPAVFVCLFVWFFRIRVSAFREEGKKKKKKKKNDRSIAMWVIATSDVCFLI